MNESDILCPDSYRFGVNIFSITLTFPMVFAFLSLSLLLIRNSKSFHPFFTISFVLLIISYLICNTCVLIKSIFELFVETHPVIEIIDTIYLWFYMYIQPCVVIGLLERLCSTILVDTYEHSRNWFVFLLAQVISVLIIWWEKSLEFTSLMKYLQFGFSICICLCLIILFFVNRRLTYNSRHRSQLTVRYQLTENVKALRIFVPFVVIDNCISIMFVISMQIFQVDFNFDFSICQSLPSYKTSFAIFRAILLLVQLFMPLIVIKQHASIWAQIHLTFQQISTRSKENKEEIDQNKVFKIHNVLGMEIGGANEDHFAQLKIQWLKRT